MKKTSIISIIILIIAIVSFALINTQNSQASKSDILTPKTVIINIHGCDNCNNVAYCLNNMWNYVNSCQIELQLEPGNYSICIGCSYQKSAVAIFTVVDDGSGDIQYVDVRVTSGTACICDMTKKK